MSISYIQLSDVFLCWGCYNADVTSQKSNVLAVENFLGLRVMAAMTGP